MRFPEVADVVTVLGKELRETLRDRRTLAVMVLFPLVVYPVVSLLMAEVISGKQAADDARMSRVGIVADPSVVAAPSVENARHVQDVRAILRRAENKIEIIDSATTADVAAGRLDAMLTLKTSERSGTPVRVRIIYDETHDASEKAHARVETALSAVLPPGCMRTYAVTTTNIAPKSKVGGYVLSKILPLIVVVMTMLGAFYPAIDITAGERERGTLETLLASPIHRFDLMTGKVLAVAALAALTGILNIASISLTVVEGARLAGSGQVLTIPWTRASATLLTVIPAAFLFGAVMVAIGAMARSFKEAQNLLTPVYFLCFTPSLIANLADFRLAGIALVAPGTNLTLLARDLMLGEATPGQTAIVLASTLLYGALALAFAARLYDSERLLAATDAEIVSLGAWIRHLMGRPRHQPNSLSPEQNLDSSQGPSAGHAIALFGIAFVLWFFAFVWLQRWRLLPGLLLSQWGGFFGLVLIYARLVRRPLRRVLVLGRPSAWAFVGAVFLGFSGWVILGVLADRLMPPPRALVDEMRKLIRPPEGDRPLSWSLGALALTPAICEEALFRGPILRGFRRRFSASAACLLTGLLFGIMHGDVWRFIPTSLLGALLSWVALTSGSILPSMLIHLINNGALIVLGYYRWDQAAEKLPPQAETALLAAALALFATGIVAVRRSRPIPPDYSRFT